MRRKNMMIIPQSELQFVGGAGPAMDVIKEYSAAIPLAGGIGAGIGVNSTIQAAGGLGYLGTLGAGVGTAALVGVGTAAIAGVAVGTAIINIPIVSEKLGDLLDYWFAGN
jgi:hypothetical protein